MYKNTIIFKLLSLSALLLATGAFSIAYASTINLYEQPKQDAKQVGTVDLASGIIPIYAPKGSEWTKVADPKNGNVGWVKSSDLSKINSVQTSVSYSNQTPNSQVMFFEQPKLTPEQAKELAKQIEIQQQNIQRLIQQSVQPMIQNVSKLFPEGQSPFIMPTTPPAKEPLPNPKK
jgi:hypothetical protein